ncbi:MAG: hypothetical protein NVSMB13_02950 [Mycobacteriales bacterium]
MADRNATGGDHGHPGFDLLAELDAGALEGAGAGSARAHVEGCGPCRESLDALAATRADLAAMPALAMPGEVADRLSAALAAPAEHPGTSVTTLPAGRPARSRRRRRFTVAGSAAAAVIVLLVGGVVFGALRAPSAPSRSTASSASAGRPLLQTAVSATGRNYARAELPAAVPGLVHPLDRQAAGAAAPQAAPSAPDAALDRLRTPAALRGCLTELTGSATATALALDYAQFEGAPALIAVVPSVGTGPNAGTQADVFVVGPGCAPSDAQLRYLVRVPRPA